ncbi:MAG: site-specific DNA-methyltransferase [Acidobacteria bacterium]|nr:MAG: site-specific DNA-methyltransferase [Acidobacteriota bacterium]
MVEKKQKLELTWIGKENRPRLEPRVLLEGPSKSYHAGTRVTDHDIFDNRLIHGDNLLALKSLEREFAGKIKCVFIDPPYNTGIAFEQYEDGLEHSIWLSLIRDRLELLRRLLAPEGSLWATLDDNEAHYFKVLGDEVFGRDCFIADIAWQKRDGPPNDRRIGSIHDHVLVWGREKLGNSKKTLAEEQFNLMPRTAKADAQYQVFREPDGPDERGPFRKIDTTANGKGGRFVESLFYAIVNPYTKEEVWPRKGTCWRHSREEMQRLQSERRLYWGAGGKATTPMRKLFKSEAKAGMTTPSIWTELALNQHASSEMEMLFGEKAFFETPKPEGLLARIIHIASNPNEWVLDSFAGSGTTGAVAHKMRRKWIMVELGEHCHTHIVPRLKQVVDGTDQGGVSKQQGWNGGGGFRYYRIAPSLLERDKFGNWVISKQFNAAMLAEAMCKLEAFTYAPSDTEYWMHGYSTERDFIYVTTQTLTREQLQKLSEDVGENRSLLVCCSAFRARDLSQFPNLTVKKIPKMVLNRCEWGKDDYSLEIRNLPPPPELFPEAESAAEPRDGKRSSSNGSMDLFAKATEREGGGK